ncbi:MAG TPA: hypothetical protein VFO11_09870 [Candidatus Polarisedimenticolaceae bacterium]|nr:hypothetical protein [Candidatus Polarisedimenticolaceae bacterium]
MLNIRHVRPNERKRIFEIEIEDRTLAFPYVRADPRPTRKDRVWSVTVHTNIAHRGFSYVLASGRRGMVQLDRVFEYNEDPSFLKDLLLYRLTLEAKRRMAASDLSSADILRRLKTSPTQLSRILDASNYRTSLDQVVSLLQALDCEIDVVVRDKSD